EIAPVEPRRFGEDVLGRLAAQKPLELRGPRQLLEAPPVPRRGFRSRVHGQLLHRLPSRLNHKSQITNRKSQISGITDGTSNNSRARLGCEGCKPSPERGRIPRGRSPRG